MNQQNRQLDHDESDRFFEEVLDRILHWARVQSVLSALGELQRTTHSPRVKKLGSTLTPKVKTTTWSKGTLEGLVFLTHSLRDEKSVLESKKAGRTAQRSAGTITAPALADLTHSVIEYCEKNRVRLPADSADLLIGQSFPSASRNGVKRLRAALVSAVAESKSISQRARLAKVDRGALGDWSEDQSFRDLVKLIQQDRVLANKAATQFL